MPGLIKPKKTLLPPFFVRRMGDGGKVGDNYDKIDWSDYPNHGEEKPSEKEGTSEEAR